MTVLFMYAKTRRVKMRKALDCNICVSVKKFIWPKERTHLQRVNSIKTKSSAVSFL
ncbi:Uncharacterized protein FWK35_00025085 [Aphis craccivora]|uniref:Uncharacterized protein n=1 Tax=Aphis craccivora TaxID=307492 RepID=A0A6G0Z2B6_APHCR|nr:Uncharacterized protein FWK35_00025085 [Aphis craccivora]